MEENINLNKYMIGPGDNVILDNKHKVEVVSAGKIFARVKKDSDEWDVMITRLEPKKKDLNKSDPLSLYDN